MRRYLLIALLLAIPLMAYAAGTSTELGTFANSTAAEASVTAEGWTLAEGMCYFDTTADLRYCYDGAGWDEVDANSTAAGLAHTQGTDAGLDTGGANAVTAAQAKAASDHVTASGASHSDVASNTSARHTQGTDQGLDTGGANPITAATAKAHVDSTSNPHATDIGNIGAGTLAELNTAVSDATLVGDAELVEYSDLTDGYLATRSGAGWTGTDPATLGADIPDCYATDTAELVACVGGASSGDWIYAAAGTYTLTSVTGSLALVSGVTLQGAGTGRTIITQDGTLADNLIEAVGSAVGTYGIAAAAQWAVTGATDTAAEAGNITAGDLLHLQDPATGERLLTVATASGNPGTGALAWAHPLPILQGATATVTVYDTYTEDITIRDLTVQAESGATDSALYFLASKNLTIEDVELLGPNNANTDPAFAALFLVGGHATGLTIDGFAYRGLWILTEYTVDMQCRGGAGNPGGELNQWSRIAYSHIKDNSSGGTTTNLHRLERSHRSHWYIISSDNVTNCMIFNAATENVYESTCRGATNLNGSTGNVGEST